MRTSNANAARCIARDLGKFRRCGGEERAHQRAIRAYASAGNARTRQAPALEGIGRLAKFNAHRLQYVEGLILDSYESLLVQKRVIGNPPRHISRTTV